MSTIDIQTLIQQRDALERQIEAARIDQRAQALARIAEIVNVADLTPDQVMASLTGTKRARGRSSPKATTASKVEPKYRHPTTGATWTGRGLKPKWLTAELEQGKTLSDFLINPPA